MSWHIKQVTGNCRDLFAVAVTGRGQERIAAGLAKPASIRGCRAMSLPESVTTWVQQLKAGGSDAAQALWHRYFTQLVELASRHLAKNVCRAADSEDVALSAFASFCKGAAAGRFPQLADRHDLWRLLLTITLRQARNLALHETRERRDSHRSVRAIDLFDLPNADLDRLADTEPDPALAAEIADELRHLLTLLPGEDLRQVARDLLSGYTAAEMARRLGCSLRTIERRWSRIRQFWEPFAVAKS
jgi:DNA-directed RNA polymerase specialized sigma24 family protein